MNEDRSKKYFYAGSIQPSNDRFGAQQKWLNLSTFMVNRSQPNITHD